MWLAQTDNTKKIFLNNWNKMNTFQNVNYYLITK